MTIIHRSDNTPLSFCCPQESAAACLGQCAAADSPPLPLWPLLWPQPWPHEPRPDRAQDRDEHRDGHRAGPRQGHHAHPGNGELPAVLHPAGQCPGEQHPDHHPGHAHWRGRGAGRGRGHHGDCGVWGDHPPSHLLTARPGRGGPHHLADQVLHAAHLPSLLPHQQDPGLGPWQRDRDGLQQRAADGANQVT